MAASPGEDDRSDRPGVNRRRRTLAILLTILVLVFVLVFGYLLLVSQIGQ
jgi:hypothetical protein